MEIDLDKSFCVYVTNVPLQFFERGHPVVYRQIYTILVPSKHNTCKDQIFITTWLYLATCFGR